MSPEKHANMLACAQLAVKRIDMTADMVIETARQTQADKMLALFRELLAEHALHNHEIRLSRADAGKPYLTLDGTRSWVGIPAFWRPLAIVETLRWIEEQLSHDWDYLTPDNTLLNEPKEQ